MNKSYRVVWNASTSTWCAASEIARGRSKSSRSAKSKIAAAAAIVVASMGSAYADEVDAVDPSTDDRVLLTKVKSADPENLKRGVPDTRAVVTDNSAYVKINAKGDGSDNASALGENAIAIGAKASTRPAASGLGGAVAIGGAATAAGNNVALGTNAAALGEEGAIALGAGANAGGKSSIALGNEAQATGWGAYALGRKAKATAESSLAIGDSSMATRQGAMAIGAQAAAAAENATAIGLGAAARGADSLALGSYSEADRDQTVSVGTAGFERQIINVGRGTQANDAVNVSQLKGVTEALGGTAAVGTDGNIKKPAYTIGSKTYDNVGDALVAASKSGGGSANAVEYDTDAKTSVTLGDTGAAAVKLTNVRAATLSASSTDAVNGAQLFATNNRVTKVEQSLNDSGLIDPSTGESLAVVYKDATKGTVALGGTGGTVVTNVKAGKVASASKDAVNGGQLYDVSTSVASALGGESAVNADGTLSKPTYKVGDKTYNNVGDALQAAASSAGAGGEDTNAVHYDGTNKSSVTLGGTAATKPVALKNVATGTAATDAVNVAQLQGGLSDVKDEIKKDLGDGTLDMKYIKVNATGMQANALGKNSVAIGSQALATNADTLAIGSGARASAKNSVAIGINSVATSANTVSVGDTAATRRIVNVSDGIDETDAVTMKQLSNAMQTANTRMSRMTRDVESKPGTFVAIEGMGADGTMPNVASINGADPTLGSAAAIGVGSAAGGLDTVAIGLQAAALSEGAVALGSIAQTGVDQPFSVAIGSMVTTNAAGALAIGSHVKANGENAVAVGNNGAMAIGKSSIAMGDKATTLGGSTNSVALGKSAKVAQNVTDAMALGANTSVGSAAAIGVGSAAGGLDTVAIGLQAVALSDGAVALGSLAQTGVDQPFSIAMGSMVTTNGAGALAIGSHAKANAENAVAVGNNGVMAVGKSSIAMGDKATTLGGSVNGIAIGTNANVAKNVADAVALGANSKALQSNSIALGANSIADRANALSIGTAGAERQIIHVAKGTQNTDAVNLAQLKGLANVVGGGTGFDANGDVTAPTYTIDGKEYHNVNDALQAAAKSGNDGGNGTDPNAVAYDGTQKDSVTLAGQNGTTLSNVADGKADKDAVNVSQLKSSGLIDEDGKSVAAVTYEKNADGTPNYKSVKLAGESGTILSNVAAGKADTDAVNVSQLKSSGLIGESGKSLAAVTYDTHPDGTTDFASVTFGGTNAGIPVALHNIAAGKKSTDAVNVSQLKGVTEAIGGGLGIDADGKVTAPVYTVDGTDYASVGDAIKALEQRDGGTGNGTNPNAVAYDDATRASVTLAGEKGTGTVIRNVADGSLALDSTEAVNGGQMNFALSSIADGLGGGAKFDPVTGDISAPTYELTAADGFKDTYDNVGDAFTHVDERMNENAKQIETLTQGVKNAVQYDDDKHTSITLGGVGAAAPVKLKNVADGTDETDAVNVRQLRSAGLVGEDGKLQSAVVYDKNDDGTTNYGSVTLGGKGAAAPVALHNVAAGTAKTDAVNVSQLSGVTDALGGGAKVDETTGEVVAPTYNVGGGSFHTAGDALTNIDNRVTQIQNNLGEATKLVGAVAYDKNGDGTVNWSKVTLGNGLSSGPVVLTNIADGKSQYDAVNYGQFSKLEGRVNDIDERLNVATTPGDGNNGGSGKGGNDLISGTGGSGKDSGEVVVAKPGTGNGNIAVGSGSQVADAKNNGTAIGAGSKVQADDGTALGHGATVSSGATNSVALGSGSKATEANTVSIGSDGHERRLVNVADGISKTDAVNKGQLDRAIGGMQGQINDMSRNAYSGIAAATALTMIPGVDPGKTLSFGVGGASYKGYQAVAMGGEARITENLKMRAGVGLSSGGNTFGVGASYQW
jgi:autotransporter adhesin